jgi:iron complex outermembrane recepter protein
MPTTWVGLVMRMTVVAAALGLCLFGFGLASEAQASIHRPTNIAAQKLGPALRKLAQEQKFQVLFRSELVRDLHSSGAVGELTTDEALTQVLSGTGLTYRYLDANTVTILPIGSPPAQTESSPAAPPDPGTQDGDNSSEKEGKTSSSPQFRLAQVDQGAGSQASAVDNPRYKSSETSSSPATLEEIVVTAQKRNERLLDVPSSIIALSGETLQDQHLTRLEDYVARVPGLTFASNGAGYQQLVIRGISTGSAGNPTVATYIDNAPVGWSTSASNGELMTQNLDSNDIQQIEVLRGPQGTLYGADNLGGLIKYDLASPNLQQWGGRLWVDAVDVPDGGSGYAARGRVSIPVIADQLAMLVSGFTREDPGFIKDAALGLRNLNTTLTHGGRAALLWRPADNLSLRLSAMSNDRSIGGTTEEDVDPVTLGAVYGDLQQRRAASTGAVISRFRLYTFGVDWSLDGLKLAATTSYGTLHQVNAQDLTNYFQPAFATLFGTDLGYAIHDADDQTKLSQEVRLEFATGEHLDWRLGGFFTHEIGSVFEYTNTFDPVTGAPVAVSELIEHAVTSSTFIEYAGFGEVTYHLTKQLDITGGLRYARNDQSIGQNYMGLIIGPPVNTHTDSGNGATTFQFSPRYKLNDNLMAYGRIASGYRPGGPNYPTNPPTPLTYSPDRDTNYEAGFKASLPQQRLSFDLALFYMDWKSIQLPLITPLGLNYIGNASSASSRGLEASFAYMPLAGLSLSGAASYTDAHLTSAIPSGAVGAAGDSLPYSPHWKGSLYADYNFPSIGRWAPFVGGSYVFTAAEQANFASSPAAPRIRLPAYQTVDGRAGVHDERWTLQVFVENLANKRSITNETPLSADPRAPIAAGIIQPRTIVLSLIARF